MSSVTAQKTAITYLRVSTVDQATRGGREEGFSIPAQREANTRKAESLGAVITSEFVDAGESGISATKRPELQRMLAWVRENPVDYCIVHKLDRLARSRADDVAIHFALTQAGVTLVSTSENIDETPSGMLMHGIMSSIAEFYSRNLANEVTKGMVQKASIGGTVCRAPLGYKNVHITDELGRINRSVEIDATRAHLVTWAFYRYAEGETTIRILLDELNARRLRTRATPKWPSRPLTVTAVHKLLRNPYYKGEIRYRGVAYPGLHEPLIDPETWQQVQDLLSAHAIGGTHQRTNQHYLRGSVFCGSCGSRLMVTKARNRWGSEYPYLVCSGRSRKITECKRQAMAAEHIEELIEDEHRSIALSPELRDNIEELVLEDFDALQAASSGERQQMEGQRVELVAKRQKLLDAHYAGAVPIDLLKTEQERIAAQLGRIQQELSAADANYEQARSVLADTLDLTRDCYSAYLEAGDVTRRLFNQAFFSKIYIDEDDETRERSIRVDYNEPFGHLLSRLVPARVHHELQEQNTALLANAGGGFGGENGGTDRVQGSHKDTLVGAKGLEPLTCWL